MSKGPAITAMQQQSGYIGLTSLTHLDSLVLRKLTQVQVSFLCVHMH